MQAALAGEGVALGWSFSSQLLLRNKLLIKPVGDEVRTGRAFFLIADERSAKNEKLEMLVDWLLLQTRDLR